MDAVLQRLRRYVAMESPSGDSDRIRALAGVVGADLRAAGATVRELDAGAAGVNLHARLPGTRSDLKPILVLGHIDTVWGPGTIAERPFRIDGNRAYGPGIYDMKAGVAVAVEALSAMSSDGGAPRRSIEILLNCDEEVGSRSSRAAIEERATEAEAVLVLEPSLPGGAAKTARKGIVEYRLVARGVAAHSGIEPGRGVSAILELAAQIHRIRELADREKGTTLNVGRIGGGTAVNMVAPEAWAELEARYWTLTEARRVAAALHALEPVLPGATLEITARPDRPPFERTPAVEALYHRAREIALDLGLDLGEGAVGGASDGNWTAALGVPTLDGLGVRGEGAHAVDEHIEIDDLPFRVTFLRRLLERL